jgi:NhaA family Na+:H+ antiporter
VTNAQPPETWPAAHRIAVRVMAPLERFLRIEAASGIVLLLAALAGLLWANSPWADAYHGWLHTEIVLRVGWFAFEQDMHFVINEGLMTIFFLVVGLEIRREMHEGELSQLKKAALPLAAALGGMIAPALFYLALNDDPALRHGWGVPMATDIAFAVGVLALLGKRVPAALRVLLLALAIIDDIGAIVVIAVFYSGGVTASGLLVAGAGVLLVVLLQRLGVRTGWAYVAPGAAIWSGLLASGVHPTIGGVVLGLITPVRAWFGSEGFVEAARAAVDKVEAQSRRTRPDTRELLKPLRDISRANREVLAPVVRIEAALHPWVAFGIMPLFALANAGVELGGFSLDAADTRPVFMGVLIGLLFGKPIGIVLASWIGVKAGMCALPRGVSWRGVALVGVVGGIGFTMAIFIAGLAFSQAELLASAKMAIMLSSGLAAVLGLAAGRAFLPSTHEPDAAVTLEDAEHAVER